MSKRNSDKRSTVTGGFNHDESRKLIAQNRLEEIKSEHNEDANIAKKVHEAYIKDNYGDAELFEIYLEHCRGLQDSIEHINYMIGSSKCFEQWCEEYRSQYE